MNGSNEGQMASSQAADSSQILYEVNEVEEVMFVTLDDKYYKSVEKSGLLEEERVEQVIEDEDYDYVPSELESRGGGEAAGGVRRRVSRRYGNAGKNIQERRIPSFCDRFPGHSETLVIDDVRHSAMIEIAGVSHVTNAELEIDPDGAGVSCGQGLGKAMSGGEGAAARKTSNRSVIVVDDRIFSGVVEELEERFGARADQEVSQIDGVSLIYWLGRNIR